MKGRRENKAARINLLLGGTRVMNQVLRNGADKGTTKMTNVNTETNAAAPSTAEAETVSPAKAAANKPDSRKKAASKGKGPKTAAAARPIKRLKTVKKSARKPGSRAASKSHQILAMVGRAKGATLAEIMEATRW